MWNAVQDEFDLEVEGLQRQRPNRRLTRLQRRTEALHHQEQSSYQPEDRGDVAVEMARAMLPDDNVLGAALSVPADSWVTDRMDASGGALGRTQETELRGAAASIVEAVRGTPLPPVDAVRHRNSPNNSRLRDVIDRRNAARELWEAAERGTQADTWGGARPRTGRLEERSHFLAQRLERQGLLEAERAAQNREAHEWRMRYDEERAEWRRREDEMAMRMRQMQTQLDMLRLQQQQTQQPLPPQHQPAPAPQNQPNPLPPPPPPPAQPPQAPQQQPLQQPQQMQAIQAAPAQVNPFLLQPPLQINVPPMVHQHTGQSNAGFRVHTPAEWFLPPPPLVPRQRRMATPVGPRTPGGFTPGRQNLTDEEQLERNEQAQQQLQQQQQQHREDNFNQKNLKLRMFKGKDVGAWKYLFEQIAQQFNWSPREKKLQLMANVEDWIRNMFIGTSAETTAEDMMQRLVSRFGVNMTSTEVENKMLGLERKPGEDLYSLADRVRNLAYRAEFSNLKRNMVMRQALCSSR